MADRCPTCSELMYRRTVQGVETNGCPTCGSVWLDTGELQQLAKTQGGVQALADTFRPGTPRAAPRRTGLCIRCDATLAPFTASEEPSTAVARRFDSIAQPGASGAFWAELRTTDQVFIQQRFEPGELFGVETRNSYELSTARGPLGFAAEQGKGFFGFVARQYLGHWRDFEILVFDAVRAPVLRVHHPFRWFFSRLEVWTPEGQLLGALQQRFSLLHKRFDVEDARGQVVLSVESPLWKPWTFPFMRGGTEVGVIRKRWAGVLLEAFTDQDRFSLDLTAGLPEGERALLLAAALFVDLRYFERKASR